MPDAVLMDWEGVLCDTSAARQDAIARALAIEHVPLEHGSPDPSDDPAAFTLAALRRRDPTLAGLLSLRAAQLFAASFSKGFTLLPGAREFVETVQLTSRVAIVTTATRSETAFMLRLSGLDDAVSVVVSADDDADAAPAPEMFVRALDQLARTRALRRDHVVAIAASGAALRAARDAGVRTLACGAPAHVALLADAAVDAVDGLTAAELSRLTRVASAGRAS